MEATLETTETKTCKTCQKEKALECFRERKDKYKSRIYLYRESKCIECERTFSRQNTAKYNAKFKDEIAAKRKYLYHNDPEQRAKEKARWKARYATHRESLLAYREQYRQDNLAAENARGRRYHLMRKYGLTPDDYLEMLEAQGGVCAICEASSEGGNLHVDHDHKTGAVRGLLCGGCNRAIGNLGDDTDRLLLAVGYLEFHSQCGEVK